MKEEEKQTKKPVSMKGKKMMKKRWVYPAVYLSFAAVILTSVLWYQHDAKNEAEDKTPNSAFEGKGTAVPVSLSKERFQMPVADPDNISVVREFFSEKLSPEKQEAALVVYNNIFYQNRGVDLAQEDGKSFDVTAALSGNVVKVAKDPALGWVVELEHDKGVVTHYSSLASVSVKQGDQVKQGTVLGKAGENAYDRDAKVHAHFEVRKDGEAIDPVMAWDQSVAQLASAVNDQRKEMKKQEEEKATEEKQEQKSEEPKSSEPKSDDTKMDKSSENKEKESSSQSSEDSDAPSPTDETSADDSGASE